MSSQTRGFSLVEMTLAIGISGIMLGGLWQVMNMAGQYRQEQLLATQAISVASAAQTYLRTKKADLLALTSLNAIGNVARVRVIDGDTGESTVPSLKASAYLPADFINLNSYGQQYVFFVRREDGGAVGVDADDNLVGLLVAAGGQALSDVSGGKVSANIGAAGGFRYVGDAGSSLINGTSGGWTADVASEWSAASTFATAGRFAILTNLLPNTASANLTLGATDINSLSDGTTDYAGTARILMGSNTGTTTMTGNNLMMVGSNILNNFQGGADNTAIGHNIGGTVDAATASSQNTLLGTNNFNAASPTLRGNSNTVLGHDANNYSISGTQNNTTVIGSGAATYASGSDMTIVGYRAAEVNNLGQDTTGSTIIGRMAWHGGGTNNAVVGTEAGADAARNSGTQNAIMGYRALKAAGSGGTPANNNVAVGSNALGTGTSTSNNVAIGAGALYNELTYTTSIAVGYRALYNGNGTSGASNTYNIALGAYTLYGSTPISNNSFRFMTAIGHSALRNARTNPNFIGSTAIGYAANLNAGVADGNVSVGSMALRYGANCKNMTTAGYASMAYMTGGCTTANGNGNSAAGAFALLGYDQITPTNNSGNKNSAAGYSALANISSGSANIAIGSNAGLDLRTGTFNTFAGYNTTAGAINRTSSTALGNNAAITENNQIVLGNTAIGKISAQVTTITALSDARHKTEIANLPLGLDFIRQLHPVQYRLNSNPLALRYGFIAQEVEKALPSDLANLIENNAPDRSLALINRDVEGERTYHMGYDELISPLVKAVQELSHTISANTGSNRRQAIEARLAAQQLRIKALEAEITHLSQEAAP